MNTNSKIAKLIAKSSNIALFIIIGIELAAFVCILTMIKN